MVMVLSPVNFAANPIFIPRCRAVLRAHLTFLQCSCWESQRDSGLQPQVAKLPWENCAAARNPNGVVACRRSPPPQPRWGCHFPLMITQGGSFLATLGLEPESLWDSRSVFSALQERGCAPVLDNLKTVLARGRHWCRLVKSKHDGRAIRPELRSVKRTSAVSWPSP